MFPNQEITTSSEIVDSYGQGKTPLFDFETGEFVIKDGKIQFATGLEALKIWIQKVLSTEKNKFKIYEKDIKEDEFGIAAKKYLFGDYPFNFVKAEIETEITRALSKHSDINSVGQFEFTRNKRTLTVNFTVNTVYGTTSEEVSY